MKSWRHLVKLISIFGVTGGLVFAPFAALSEAKVRKSSVAVVASALVDLPNGTYQFCTEPAPQDWRDGAGACLIITKIDTTASGYYGYPHSESFICLDGEISQTDISGTGMAISWAGDAWTGVPGSAFYWDEEARLFLAKSDWVRQQESAGWIVFQQAKLDTQGLYQYENPKMTPSEQLCNWQFELPENRQ